MLVGSKVVKPLQHKLFGGKLNTPRAMLGQKLIRVGINQLKNHIQDNNKPHCSHTNTIGGALKKLVL